MKERKSDFNILESIEQHIGDLKPLLPKQAVVCAGEYPIKTLLKESAASKHELLPIFIEKSTDDIYKWLPKDLESSFVLGFEDSKVDTHYWYTVLPYIQKDNSILEAIHKRTPEQLRGAIIFASLWDGVGSAALPAYCAKFQAEHIDSFSIAVLPSKIQPGDAHFNACGAIQTCLSTEGAALLLIDRECMAKFEGVNSKGVGISDTTALNYLLNLFITKQTFVEEIAELSRTFGIKLFNPLAVIGASYAVYGSIENLLNAAILKPLLTSDLSSASLLYVLLRMPSSLKDKIPRAKIDLVITEWFRNKASPQSIHITEPVYTEEKNDRIDVVLLVGDAELDKKYANEAEVVELKRKAVEDGFITEDWQVIPPKEEPKVQETILPLPVMVVAEQPSEMQDITQLEQQPLDKANDNSEKTLPLILNDESKPAQPQQLQPIDSEKIQEAQQIQIANAQLSAGQQQSETNNEQVVDIENTNHIECEDCVLEVFCKRVSGCPQLNKPRVNT